MPLSEEVEHTRPLRVRRLPPTRHNLRKPNVIDDFGHHVHPARSSLDVSLRAYVVMRNWAVPTLVQENLGVLGVFN